MSPSEYCRQIEAYLCQKNEGHLIRIVGPVFETVCDWARQGVPIKVAFQGIDRCVERRQAKGPRRRPVRVEFCEADILDAFDAWRRAVGVGALARVAAAAGAEDAASHDPASHDVRASAADVDGSSRAASAPTRQTGLHTHIDRVMARLTQRRVEIGGDAALGLVMDRLLGELDALRAGAKGVRGDARETLARRLAILDDELLGAARSHVGGAAYDVLRAEAGRELEPFRTRMDAETFGRTLEQAALRLLRVSARLPEIRIGP